MAIYHGNIPWLGVPSTVWPSVGTFAVGAAAESVQTHCLGRCRLIGRKYNDASVKVRQDLQRHSRIIHMHMVLWWVMRLGGVFIVVFPPVSYRGLTMCSRG